MCAFCILTFVHFSSNLRVKPAERIVFRRKEDVFQMGKVEANKENKRSSLLSHAYELFLNKGFNDTTISDIVKKSNVAKGTFYLYFKDKYDLRDQLVARQSAQVFLDAAKSIEMTPTEKQPKTVIEYVDALINYILDYLQNNKMLLRFITKNLSWGIFRHLVEEPAYSHTDGPDLHKFYSDYLKALQEDHITCDRPDFLLFSIAEFVGSTAYSTIINEDPCTMEEYKPYLFRTIHSIIDSFCRPDGITAQTSNP